MSAARGVILDLASYQLTMVESMNGARHSVPAFRHDPVKSVVVGRENPARVAWNREPVVCGHRRLTFARSTTDAQVAVPVSASPAVVAGVGVVFASDDGYLRFLDRSLAKEYWRLRLDSSIYSSLLVDISRRRILVASTKGAVASVDLRGTAVWRTQTGLSIYATPTVLPASDTLVLPTFQSRCLGLSLETGEVRFDTSIPAPWHAEIGGIAAYRDAYASPSTTLDGLAVLCCAEHALCLAPDGKELWRTDLGATVKASPVVVHATGQVAVFTVDGRCVFLDGTTGRPLHEVRLGSKITSSPALSGDVLAVGLQRDVSVGINVCNYERVWTSREGSPRSYTSFTVLPNGTFVCTTERGNIVCLRAEDGVFLWETSQVLGLVDHDPAIDITPVAAPDGNMYAASYGGDVYCFRFPSLDQEEGDGT